MSLKPSVNLLGLPREIRDLILAYSIHMTTALSTRRKSFHNIVHGVSASPPPICGVNTLLRAETLRNFYAVNVFQVQLHLGEGPHDVFSQWLNGIAKDNVQHIRHLEICGWLQIPYGHMEQKRWVVALFNLREGTMIINDGSKRKSTPMSLLSPVQELQAAFADIVQTSDGKPFGRSELERLVEGFYGLCTG